MSVCLFVILYVCPHFCPGCFWETIHWFVFNRFYTMILRISKKCNDVVFIEKKLSKSSDLMFGNLSRLGVYLLLCSLLPCRLFLKNVLLDHFQILNNDLWIFKMCNVVLLIKTKIKNFPTQRNLKIYEDLVHI